MSNSISSHYHDGENEASNQHLFTRSHSPVRRCGPSHQHKFRQHLLPPLPSRSVSFASDLPVVIMSSPGATSAPLDSTPPPDSLACVNGSENGNMWSEFIISILLWTWKTVFFIHLFSKKFISAQQFIYVMIGNWILFSNNILPIIFTCRIRVTWCNYLGRTEQLRILQFRG